MNVEDYIHATNRADSPDALFRLFVAELEQLGLDRVVYSFMTDSPLLKKCAQHGVMRNYPDDWMKYYGEKNYILHDPVYRTALVSRKPFTWHQLMQEKPMNRIQKRVMMEAKEAGLKDGIAMSIQGASGDIIGVGVASSGGGVDLSRDAVCKIHVLINQFHLCYSDFLADTAPFDITQIPPLTSREREILLWCSRGKSSNVIGDLMSISDKTVEAHLGRIFKKFGTTSRVQTVLMALRLGLISV